MVVVGRAERRSVEREVHGDRRIFLGSQQASENLGGRARKVGRAARATMAPERRARLDAAPWWSWTVPR